jgi:hypothetical protein
MTIVTLDAIKAEQTKLAKMIADFETTTRGEPVAYLIDEVEISLAPGEHYAGLVLDADGDVSHHLVLLAGQADGVSWQPACAWAESIGGVLPTRQEQALLYANLKGRFEPAWYWSSEAHETDGSCAWGQGFGYGQAPKSHSDRALIANVLRGRGKAVRADLAKVWA